MIVVLALAAYLAGSIPFGLILGKAIQGIDLRDHGSGNIGATNAGRVLGLKWGLICLVLDALKGLLPVALLPGLLLDPAKAECGHLQVMTGVLTIVGHMFSCWLGFKGGKGVATSLGVVGVLSPWGLLAGVVTFAITVLTTRIISLGSMLGAVAFGVAQLFLLKPHPFSEQNWSLGLFAVAVPILIVVQHRANLRRLFKGEEPRFGQKKAVETATESDPVTQPAVAEPPASP